MRFKFIIPAVVLFQVTSAQTRSEAPAVTQATNTTAPAAVTTTTSPAAPPEATTSEASSTSSQVAIIDYKSVYEAPTVEEEVKMATERFDLTPSQQDVWLSAARDRRIAEKSAQDKFDGKSAQNIEKDAVYRGLRAAHNSFHETVTGYLSPRQKEKLETDRMILQEKQKRLTKMPPPPPTPTVAAAPVDSAAIKKEEKTKGKKSKKSKKKG